MKIHSTAILLLAIAATSCTTNVSQNLPYSKYTGHDLALNRDMILIERPTKGYATLAYSVTDAGTNFLEAQEITTIGQPVIPTNQIEMRFYLEETNFTQPAISTSVTGEQHFWSSIKATHQLPRGHHVVLQQIINEKGDGFHAVTAKGTTTVPQDGRSISFDFTWGWNTNLFIAPWEPIETPRERAIGWNGNLKDK